MFWEESMKLREIVGLWAVFDGLEYDGILVYDYFFYFGTSLNLP